MGEERRGRGQGRVGEGVVVEETEQLQSIGYGGETSHLGQQG